ncbi:MAG: class I fructose-bisphosphate aldolase, partial [Rickettsiales bacterium]
KSESFAINKEAYDPEYHINLAIDAELSAYAAPLGMIESIANKYAGTIPLILKINSSNLLEKRGLNPYQSITATVADALRLGCCAIGFTIYPGSKKSIDMINELRSITSEAKSVGIAVIVWSYPRGGHISKEGESSVDVCAYSAHIAAILGANIIKVKIPNNFVEDIDSRNLYEKHNIKIDKKSDRINHIVRSCFNGKRIVVFSGGSNKNIDDIIDDTISIRDGGGGGSIIGRNSFQRTRDEALSMLKKINNIYLNKND